MVDDGGQNLAEHSAQHVEAAAKHFGIVQREVSEVLLVQNIRGRVEVALEVCFLDGTRAARVFSATSGQQGGDDDQSSKPLVYFGVYVSVSRDAMVQGSTDLYVLKSPVFTPECLMQIWSGKSISLNT